MRRRAFWPTCRSSRSRWRRPGRARSQSTIAAPWTLGWTGCPGLACRRRPTRPRQGRPMIPMRSSRAGRRPVPPVRLPRAHRVVYRLAGGKGVTIYWYRRRGQTPAMISFTGLTMAAALEAEREGADEIAAAYGATRPAPPVTQLKDLVTRYKMAPDGWKRVAESTKATWSPWLDKISAEFGDMPIGAIGAKGVRSAIIEWRDTFAATPRTADIGMQVFTRVLNWAVHRELIEKNPA